MLIDWFTVGAQALNFIILVWLLKRFLYKPILSAIDAREEKIAAELADADAKRTEALKERSEFRHKNEQFDQQRAALMSNATAEAHAERQRLFDEARKGADELIATRQQTLEADAKNLNQAIRRRTQQEVFAIARRALADLASASLEERMCAAFTDRLRAINGGAKESFANAFAKSSEPALLRSAFDLPAREREAIQKALNETFPSEIRVRFETAPVLVGGIELTTNGQKVAWSIAEYLLSLERGVDELIKARGTVKDNDKPAPMASPQLKAAPNAKKSTKPDEPKTESKCR